MSNEIRVKFVAKGHLLKDAAVWRRQLPAAAPVCGQCRFIFDPDARRYDWLVVYDDLPPGSEQNQQQKTRIRKELLACPREHTLFITAEPSPIKVYSEDFLGQFGILLSSQEPFAIRHPDVIHSQPALRWFYGMPYGRDNSRLVSLDTLANTPPPDKTRDISTVCSHKRMSYTTHSRRYDFVQEVKARMPELEVFGRGVRPIDDKAEALDAYRYHIAIENHVCPHHWTEKLSDTFLGYCLPFYYGAPNVADYFPPESFIPIDIFNTDDAVEIIREAIHDDAYNKRRPAIIEARRRVLEEYNIFAVIEREIGQRHDPARTVAQGSYILSRHALRRSSLGNRFREMRDRLRVRRLAQKTHSR